jgi:hypothetical protein
MRAMRARDDELDESAIKETDTSIFWPNSPNVLNPGGMVGLVFCADWHSLAFGQLQCVGQAVHYLQLVQAICIISAVGAKDDKYTVYTI